MIEPWGIILGMVLGAWRGFYVEFNNFVVYLRGGFGSELNENEFAIELSSHHPNVVSRRWAK